MVNQEFTKFLRYFDQSPMIVELVQPRFKSVRDALLPGGALAVEGYIVEFVKSRYRAEIDDW